MKKTVGNLLLCFGLILVFSACEKDELFLKETVDVGPSVTAEVSVSCDGPEVVDMDYVASRGYHHIILRNCDGSLDAFYGDHTIGSPKDWTRSKGTRDPDKVWGELLGLAVGDGDHVVYVTRYGNGQIHVHRSVARSDGIYWIKGSYRLKAEDGSDYADLVDIEYTPSENQFVILLRKADGTTDAFYGDHRGGSKDWTRSKGTRDPDKVWGSIRGLAVGDGDHVVYVTRYGNGQIHVHRSVTRSDGIYWIKGSYRLKAEDGSDYADLVDIEYTPSRNQFVVLLRKADGTTDAFYGDHRGGSKDWTRSKGTRDPDKVWGSIQDVSVGLGDNVVYTSDRGADIHAHASQARPDGIHWTVGSYALK